MASAAGGARPGFGVHAHTYCAGCFSFYKSDSGFALRGADSTGLRSSATKTAPFGGFREAKSAEHLLRDYV